MEMMLTSLYAILDRLNAAQDVAAMCRPSCKRSYAEAGHVEDDERNFAA